MPDFDDMTEEEKAEFERLLKEAEQGGLHKDPSEGGGDAR